MDEFYKERWECIKLVNKMNKKLIAFIENHTTKIEELTYINNAVQNNFDDIASNVKLKILK